VYLHGCVHVCMWDIDAFKEVPMFRRDICLFMRLYGPGGNMFLFSWDVCSVCVLGTFTSCPLCVFLCEEGSTLNVLVVVYMHYGSVKVYVCGCLVL
jgi:hypothetical protein